ncbi:MAG: DUF2480 family protein [Cytophagaceae bacterium]
MSEDQIVNKVEASGLVVLDLEDFYDKGERVIYDIKQNLFQGLILKEKDFRDFIKAFDWSVYSGKNVGVICSEDAIVPTWAYMLLIAKIQPFANMVVFGGLEALEQALYHQALDKISWESYKDAKVVVKGCGKFPVPVFAYAEVTRRLVPVANSIMYGEPCSTVPVFKKPKKW